MQAFLPYVVPWKDAFKLYPEGTWLVSPQEYANYVHLIDGQVRAIDLSVTPQEGCFERLTKWTQEGKLEDLQAFDFMEVSSQVLPTPVESHEGKLGGLSLYTSHTRGARASYQDATAFFSAPMDMQGTWCYINGLFDGHGPSLGGDGVAKMLSDAEGLQTLTEAMCDWSDRLGLSWAQMDDYQIENGLQFIVLSLQKMIEKHVVSNLHQANIAAQARDLTRTLQQTLLCMCHVKETAQEKLADSMKEIDRLHDMLGTFYSLEGVGSTAVYTLWKVNAELDYIDLWTVNIGDSWSGMVMKEQEHYALVEEASVTNAHFHEDILARGGKIEKDENGTLRVNGQYSLCRSLGDLFVIREWTEVRACVQMKGMSPRASITKLRLCATPAKVGEVSFDASLALIHHCDGLKEENTLNSSQICSFVKQAMQHPKSLLESTGRLVARAVEGGSHDNCTLQVIDLSALANPAFRKKFYKQMRPSMVFQPSTFYHGFL